MSLEQVCSTIQDSASLNIKVMKNTRLDGGWGWMVCFGAFIVHILTVGQQNIAGVIYSIMVDEFHTNRAETGKTYCITRIIAVWLIRNVRYAQTRQTYPRILYSNLSLDST